MHTSMPADKSELLERIRRDRSELEAAIASMSNEQLSAVPAGGSWSVKDHLAHLAAWEQSIVALLQGKQRHEGLGIDNSVYMNDDIDEINRSIYELHRNASVEQVLENFHRSHQSLMQLIERMSDDDLQKPYSHYLPDEPGEDTGSPIVRWIIGDTYEHYAEHLETIRQTAAGT